MVEQANNGSEAGEDGGPPGEPEELGEMQLGGAADTDISVGAVDKTKLLEEGVVGGGGEHESSDAISGLQKRVRDTAKEEDHPRKEQTDLIGAAPSSAALQSSLDGIGFPSKPPKISSTAQDTPPSDMASLPMSGADLRVAVDAGGVPALVALARQVCAVFQLRLDHIAPSGSGAIFRFPTNSTFAMLPVKSTLKLYRVCAPSDEGGENTACSFGTKIFGFMREAIGTEHGLKVDKIPESCTCASARNKLYGRLKKSNSTSSPPTFLGDALWNYWVEVQGDPLFKKKTEGLKTELVASTSSVLEFHEQAHSSK